MHQSRKGSRSETMCHQQQQRLYPSLEEFSPVSSSLEGQGIPLPSAPRLEFSDQSTNSSSLEGQGIPLPSAPCLEEFDDWTLDELDYWLQANNKTVCPMTRVQYPSVKVQRPKPKLGLLNKLKKFFGIPQVRKSYSITK